MTDNKNWLLKTIIAILITTLITGTASYLALISVAHANPTREEMSNVNEKTRTELKDWVLQREAMNLKIVQQITTQLGELKDNQTTLRNEQVNIKLEQRAFQSEFRTRMDDLKEIIKKRN